MLKTDRIIWEKKVGGSFFRILERIGPKFNFFVFDRGHAVSAIVHLTDVDKIVLISQLRGGTNRYEIEIPAGMRDGDELAGTAVLREVLEEVGYAHTSIEHIRHLVLSPGGCTEEHDIFYVTTRSDLKVGDGGGLAVENENIASKLLDINVAIEMMRTGKIQDAKTVIALQWLENKRAGF
jgi:ADP-ribose pyrophosphatase